MFTVCFEGCSCVVCFFILFVSFVVCFVCYVGLCVLSAFDLVSVSSVCGSILCVCDLCF